MEDRKAEARGCLLMIGWLYVVGLCIGLILAAWSAMSDLTAGLGREALYGALLAIAWPLAIVALAAGHAAVPLPLWARLTPLPLVLGWIALGWWVIIRTARSGLRRTSRRRKVAE